MPCALVEKQTRCQQVIMCYWVLNHSMSGQIHLSVKPSFSQKPTEEFLENTLEDVLVCFLLLWLNTMAKNILALFPITLYSPPWRANQCRNSGQEPEDKS